MFKLTIQLHSLQMLAKFFKVGFSSMWTENFQIYKMHFKKAEKPEIKLAKLIGSWRQQGSTRNTSFYFIDYMKAFDSMYHKKLENS